MKIHIFILTALLAALIVPTAPAQPARPEQLTGPPTAPQAAAVPAAGVEMPVRSVVLFTNGVGYFRREGTVTGSGGIDLSFNVKDINDLLKSMVVQDLDGGRITGVNYASREPLARTLRTFSLDLSENPGLPELLLQARGERIEISADTRYEGTILGVEGRPAAEGEGEDVYINIIGDRGLQSVAYKGVRTLKFSDPKINGELGEALRLIAESRHTDKKSVRISCVGDGRRRIQAGYIMETPVWKTSYRLVVGEGKRHLLQGWGIVENTTDEDWNGIRLDLVSGMPVSFAMDLYQPLFNPRPVIPYSVRRNLESRTYGEGIAAAPPPSMSPKAPSPMRAYEMESRKSMAGALAEAESFDIAGGVDAAAVTDAVGEFFRYTIKDPVELPRRQSAMIPILNEEIEGERVSVYNEAVHKMHPMNGLKLKNTSSLNLMGGPLTVFEDGVYAGDARIDGLPPGGNRLVSFSLDLDTEVLTLDRSLPELITRIRLQRGALFTSRTLRKERTYTLVNRGGKSRTVLVEYPASADWKLVEPGSFEERTEGFYRFSVKTPAVRDARTDLRIAEERTLEQSAALTSMAGDTILFYINQRNISPAVRSALEILSKMKTDLADISRQRQAVEGQITGIHREQERIRSNMGSLDRTSALYQRYVAALNDQENTLAALKDSLAGLQRQEAAKKKAMEDYLMALDVG